MASERLSDTKVVGNSLDTFVENLSTLYTRQLSIRNAEDELTFQEKVLSENLSLDDQLAYRKEQLKRASVDPSERRRIRLEIAGLTDRKEQQDFQDAYISKVTDYQSGLSSIDSVIQFLEDQRATTTDQTILNSIASKLSDAKGQKFDLSKKLLSDQTEYATNDKSVEVIDAQLARVNSARSTAILSGDDTLVATYDLQIQSLRKAKTETQVTRDLAELGALSATGATSAIGLLDALNSKIASASTSGSIQVGGVTYANLKDFWTFKRDSYLADSSNSGFFASLATESKNNINLLASQNALTVSKVSAATKTFDTLKGRQELQNFQTQLELYKQDVAQSGADALSVTIANQFTKDLDVSKAINDLTSIQNTLGVNVDDTITKIMQINAQTKNTQVGNILQAAQNAMANDPNLTPSEAIRQATAAGAGTVISPQQAANKSETQLAIDAANTAQQGLGTNDPRTTIDGGVVQIGPENTPQSSGNIPNASLTSLPNLEPGMTSEDVRTLQNYLIQQGYSIPDGATGYYGPQTTAAVAALQKSLGVDNSSGVGYFGPQTKSALTTSSSQQPSSPTVITPTPSSQQSTPNAPANPPANIDVVSLLSPAQRAQYDNLVSVGASPDAALTAARLVPANAPVPVFNNSAPTTNTNTYTPSNSTPSSSNSQGTITKSTVTDPTAGLTSKQKQQYNQLVSAGAPSDVALNAARLVPN